MPRARLQCVGVQRAWLACALLAAALSAGCLWSRPKPDVHREIELASGVHVQDLVLPTGPQARAGQLATFHYAAWLADGTLFDSSIERGEPTSARLSEGELVPGLIEGMLGMPLRGKRRIWVPAERGFGSAGSPPQVPPDANLVFEVELLGLAD
jgi:FKBP-type peptidyl-prolyl cis-trans isomerase